MTGCSRKEPEEEGDGMDVKKRTDIEAAAGRGTEALWLTIFMAGRQPAR